MENNMREHPMDEFPVRQLRFDYAQLEEANPLWSRSSPEFSRFINALGVHVPYFERFLVATMRAYRDELEDEQLKQDVQRIIGQEAHHAFNFVNWTRVLIAHYPGIEAADREAETYFAAAAKRAKRFCIGFTAGYETFTFLAGMIILDRYAELMADADPVLRGLWVWHQVEEVEHGAVAFDFYRAFYPDDEWYRRYMVLFAFVHIVWQTAVSFYAMTRRESVVGKLRAWRFFAGFGFDLFRASLPVFRRGYHPRRHPICTSEQNEVAVRWRQYYESGNDVTFLGEQQMQDMLAQEAT